MRFFAALIALSLCSPTAVAQLCQDDSFEDNDTIQTAVPLAAGSHPGLVITSSQSPCGLDEDFYVIEVPDGMVLRVDLDYDTSDGTLRLFLFDSPADYPNSWLARNAPLSFPNHTGTTRTYYLAVEAQTAFDQVVYDLGVSISIDGCFGAADDTLEPNDDCGQATPVTAGLLTGLHLTDFDDDYYSIDLPAGQAIRFDALYTFDGIANLGLLLQDACGTLLETGLTAGDNQHLIYTNTGGATQSLTLSAQIFTSSVGVCVDYDLLIDVFPDPCLTVPADGFEDNEDCTTATLLTPGTYGNLNTRVGDIDVYRILVRPGETMDVTVFFEHEQGNIDLESFAPGLECTHIIDEISNSLTDNESITAINLQGSDVEYFVQVFMEPLENGGTLLCNSYAINVEVTGQTGNSFCDQADGALAACPCANPGNPESGCDIAQGTGGIALSILDQSTAPQNRATLLGTGYPPMSAPGVTVIRSTTLDAASPVVFGDGLRCISVPLVRVGAGLASGGTSEQTIGHGAGAGPGTFYYQLWVRNTPIMFCTPAAFNLSNGRTIVW